MRWPLLVLTPLLFVLPALNFSAAAQVRVTDIFGRSLNDHSVTLVDWDGYMANPLIRIRLLPPTNAALPGTARVMTEGPRFYFNRPCAPGTNGLIKTVSFADLTTPVAIGLSIFPSHNDRDRESTLTIVFTDAAHIEQTTRLPIRVIDEDVHRSRNFDVTVNVDRDITGFFHNATARALVEQAANDWAYYFDGANLDPVAIGTETTYIWKMNFANGYNFDNTNNYTGYLLYAYGMSNDKHISGGEGSYAGRAQSSAGHALPLKRSGGFEANIAGNYNTLGWLFLTNDNDWLATGNLGRETNDFYSIAHHEIGHALIFNQAHPGFAAARDRRAFTSEAVTNYYGGPVPIDPSNDHLTGVIDPESGQGAFGWEYYGSIPRRRWTMTKLDLLCAQEVGYMLRANSAFAPLTLSTSAPPDAREGVPYSFRFAANGGIPIYDWEVTGGELPPGLALDAFTGLLSGTPKVGGVFDFTVRVRDYHEGSAGLAQHVSLRVASQ